MSIEHVRKYIQTDTTFFLASYVEETKPNITKTNNINKIHRVQKTVPQYFFCI